MKLGIKLITVPFWWDERLSSIASAIHQVRPDAEIPASWLSQPIPTVFPQKREPSCM